MSTEKETSVYQLDMSLKTEIFFLYKDAHYMQKVFENIIYKIRSK